MVGTRNPNGGTRECDFELVKISSAAVVLADYVSCGVKKTCIDGCGRHVSSNEDHRSQIDRRQITHREIASCPPPHKTALQVFVLSCPKISQLAMIS